MRRIFVPTLVAACIAVLWSGVAIGLPPVHRTVLDNGLVLLVSEEHSLPFVTLHLLLKTGAKDDPTGREGLANLTAGCLMLGAGGRTEKQIHDELDFMGAHMEAATNKDFTDVSLVVLRKDLDRAFPIFMDVLTKPTFPIVEVKKEVSRVLGAIQSSEDQPAVVAERAFDKSLYKGGPYGHPIEGTKSSVSKISREQMNRFHRAYFHPNNAILVIVGDIDEGVLKGHAIPGLEKWPRETVPAERPQGTVKENKETVKVDKPVTQANIIMGNKGMSRDNPDYYSALVMNYILGGGGLTSRLMENIRNKKGLAYSVESFFAAQKRSGSFQVVLQTKAASSDEAMGAVYDEVSRIRKEPVSSQELDDAKKYLIGSFPQRFSSQSRIASFFGQVEYYGLGLDYPERYSGLIERVTREDVLRIAQTYLHPDDFITVVVADLKATGPAREGVKTP